MSSKVRTISLVTLGISSMLLAACGKNNQQDANFKNVHFKQEVPNKKIKKGGTLTYALELDSPFTGIFLSEIADTAPDLEVASPGNENLFDNNEDYTYNNKGPATLKFDRKTKTATIEVKKGVRWSDGKQVTAKDVEFAYEIVANEDVVTTKYTAGLENIKGVAEYHQGKAKTISGIEMPDGENGRKVILHFKQMKPGMLTIGNHFIWNHAEPYHYLKDIPFSKLVSSEQVRQKPVTLGPFKLKKLVKGQSALWVRNPYYWRGTPNFDAISMSVVSNSNATEAIKRHRFDVASVEHYEEVKNAKNYNFIGEKSLGYSYLGFRVGKWDKKTGQNVEDPHAKMNNASLRKAMLYAMNLEQVSKKFDHGLTFRVKTPIPDQFSTYQDKSIPGYPYNPEKAKQLLDKAGYKTKNGSAYRTQPNGKPLTINLAVRNSTGNASAVWNNYIQQWKKIGLHVRFLEGRPMEFNNWVQAIKAADPRIDVFEGGWGLSSEPSQAGLYAKDSQLNFSRFVSPENTKLLNEIDSEKSFDKNYRIQAFRKWQKFMYDKAYIYPTTNGWSITAVNSKITHFSLKTTDNTWFEAGFTE